MTNDNLVLSLFPGIGLLDRGFEAAGYCVVRGPDLIWGGNIRSFSPPAGAFAGIVGGPPCQDFSAARRDEATGNGLAMLAEFIRCVTEAQPVWWLLENVPAVPDVQIDGYQWQRIDMTAREFGLTQHRLRHIQFGCNDGSVLVRNESGHIDGSGLTHSVCASDSTTPWDRFCVAQGLPADFDIPAFTVGAKRSAVGNGVPLPMATALAEMVRDRQPASDVRLCGCGCARIVTGQRTYTGSACRMRAARQRKAAPALATTGPA